MKSTLSFLKNVFIFVQSFIVFKLIGLHGLKGYQAMINLFCKTGGKSNDLVSKIISFTHSVKKEDCNSDLFGHISTVEIDKIVNDINLSGFHVLESKLDEESLKYFSEYAHTVKPNVRLMDEEIENGTPAKGKVAYDENNLVAIRYDYSEDELINDKKVQSLMGDPFFVSVAERYLKAEPKLDITTLWWHTNFSQKADDNAAMTYHFDMDRIKWLKIFIYITDVGKKNGPHCFVKKSHRTGGIPKSLLSKGYARLSDEEVESYYGQENIIEFVAPKGTIIFEDTRGLHKGKHVEEGSRLIFQLEYTNSLFGSTSPSHKIKRVESETLKKTQSRYQDLLKWYS
jgi:ectoine hydroxylase-related dioxygenase (phytanoyl-CoA dioxygenase family)